MRHDQLTLGFRSLEHDLAVKDQSSAVLRAESKQPLEMAKQAIEVSLGRDESKSMEFMNRAKGQ